MAEADEVRDAVERLAAMFDDVDDATRRKIPDATVSLLVRDLDVAYGCQFLAGEVRDIEEIDVADAGRASLRVRADSDTLIDVVDGRLHFGHGWATGRIRVDAKFRDILKLRSFL
jgi:hypothetical protein